MKKSVPARFIRPQPAENEFEISSHGRGCIAIETGGRVKVKTLLPKSGFSWMLSTRQGARLKGAFE